jgi:hypothetical protein
MPWQSYTIENKEGVCYSTGYDYPSTGAAFQSQIMRSSMVVLCIFCTKRMKLTHMYKEDCVCPSVVACHLRNLPKEFRWWGNLENETAVRIGKAAGGQLILKASKGHISDTPSLCVCVCVYSYTLRKQLHNRCKDFHMTGYLGFPVMFVNTFLFWLQSDNNNVHCI